MRKISMLVLTVGLVAVAAAQYDLTRGRAHTSSLSKSPAMSAPEPSLFFSTVALAGFGGCALLFTLRRRK